MTTHNGLRPLPPTVRLSSRPNWGDCDHDRAGPTPVTRRQPDSWTPTGWKARPSAANTSRNPPPAAVQCRPLGIGGSVQSAAARARTRGASLIVIPRGRISRNLLADRLATTRSTLWADAQSGTPADALAEAGCAAPPGTALPQAASPIRAPTAITASTHRAAAPGGPPRPSAAPTGLP